MLISTPDKLLPTHQNNHSLQWKEQWNFDFAFLSTNNLAFDKRPKLPAKSGSFYLPREKFTAPWKLCEIIFRTRHINAYIYLANKAYFYCAIAVSTRLSGNEINYFHPNLYRHKKFCWKIFFLFSIVGLGTLGTQSKWIGASSSKV